MASVKDSESPAMFFSVNVRDAESTSISPRSHESGTVPSWYILTSAKIAC